MLNKIKILSVITAVLAAALAMDFAPASAGATAIGRQPAGGVVSDKVCEKCKRGPDDKMVCEPVPCPK